MSIVYLVNNIYDIESDRLNPYKRNKNPLAKGEISVNEAMKIALILFAFDCVILMLFCIYLEIINYLILLALGVLYSVPPVRFKEKPLLDLISHSLFFGVLLVTQGYFAYSTNKFICPEILFCVILASIYLELRNEVEDFDYDKKASYKTTSVILGKNMSLIIVDIMAFTLVIYTLLLLPTYMLTISPIILIAYFAYKNKWKVKTRIMDFYVVLFLLVYLYVRSGG